jgi:hypothetical protein
VRAMPTPCLPPSPTPAPPHSLGLLPPGPPPLPCPAPPALHPLHAGAAAGNAFTISNVLAAKAVMGLQATPEALFLARTLPLGILMCVVAQAFGLIFTLGGAMGEVPPLG